LVPGDSLRPRTSRAGKPDHRSFRGKSRVSTAARTTEKVSAG
jgi:hypothetical protein